jgi:hypothetical protein
MVHIRIDACYALPKARRRPNQFENFRHALQIVRDLSRTRIRRETKLGHERSPVGAPALPLSLRGTGLQLQPVQAGLQVGDDLAEGPAVVCDLL